MGSRLRALALPSLLAVVAGGYLLSPYLPFQDLPAHAGLLALRERLAGSPFLSAHFERGGWVGPYGLFLGLEHLLAWPLGPDRALRAVAALANLALPCALLAARRQLFADGWRGAGYLGLVLALGFPTALGLSSFLLGLAALVLAVPRWLAVLMDPGGARGRAEGWLALHGVLAAFSHGFAFVLLAAIAGISLIVAPRGLARSPGRLRALMPGAGFLVWAWWRDRGFYPEAELTTLVHHAGWLDKLALPFLPTLLTRFGPDALVAVALWLLLGWSVRDVLRRSPGEPDPDVRAVVLARTAVVLAAVALVAPTRIGWFGSVDLRLCSTALLLAVLAAGPSRAGPRLRPLLERSPPWLALTMTALLVAALAAFQPEAGAPAALLRRIPANTSLLYLPLDSGSRVWAARPFLHADKGLLLDRDVLPGNLWLHPASALRSRSTWRPQPLRLDPRGGIAWPAYDLARWDHVLVRARPGPLPGGVPAGLEVVATAPGLHLFRRALRPGGLPAAGEPAGAARTPPR